MHAHDRKTETWKGHIDYDFLLMMMLARTTLNFLKNTVRRHNTINIHNSTDFVHANKNTDIMQSIFIILLIFCMRIIAISVHNCIDSVYANKNTDTMQSVFIIVLILFMRIKTDILQSVFITVLILCMRIKTQTYCNQYS